ncbi:DUF2785 domain-containing protein [Paenibacillus terrigena]|uniref:DUF2785 domain-containing protein n=1 Tax=Paenibacillus terrigena TaxID=369333 RepID=UPI0003652A7E|nr:DUF2785 domain-containing protein [Paenibacillus terrigena]
MPSSTSSTIETKQWLQQLLNEDIPMPEGDELLNASKRVLQCFHSTDAELRDNLAYSLIAKWITSSKFTSDQLLTLLDQALSSEMLLYRIGESNTSSVLMRSFSSLVIASILYQDQQEKFLSEETYTNVLHTLITYAEREMDLRGYVAEYGWVHSVAHVSDAFDELAYHRFSSYEVCQQIWQAFYQFITRAEAVFGFEEDERMAVALRSMITHQHVSAAQFCTWIETASEQLDQQDYMERYVKGINLKHVVRSVYLGFKLNGQLRGEDEQLYTELKALRQK